ncbi:hypothetical protein ASJ34_08465 [Xanthomonas campestris pv. campestris]|nr:hypothetical protein ASJ34_08465 [Xanthomonas campestris pv. campestris]
MQHDQMDHSKMMDHNDKEQHSGHGQQDAAPGEFTALDANRDGKLSKAEMAKHKLAPHFGMLDLDKNGSLSSAEFAAGKTM